MEIENALAESKNTEENLVFQGEITISEEELFGIGETEPAVIGKAAPAGIAEEVDDESGDKDKRIASFRISRILRASLMKSMGAFISKENKDGIEKDLIQKTVQYMVGDLTSIKLRFTPQGIKEFKKHLYMRPQFYVQDAEDKLV